MTEKYLENLFEFFRSKYGNNKPHLIDGYPANVYARLSLPGYRRQLLKLTLLKEERIFRLTLNTDTYPRQRVLLLEVSEPSAEAGIKIFPAFLTEVGNRKSLLLEKEYGIDSLFIEVMAKAMEMFYSGEYVTDAILEQK